MVAMRWADDTYPAVALALLDSSPLSCSALLHPTHFMKLRLLLSAMFIQLIYVRKQVYKFSNSCKFIAYTLKGLATYIRLI